MLTTLTRPSTVERMYPAQVNPAQLSIEELLRDCEVRFDRRSGPGGQHRNKVETAVIVIHLPTGMRGEASERRSQVDNRRNAIQRLRLAVALSVRISPASQSPPSDLWQSRAKNRRISVALVHEDFPALLAELLDYLASQEWDTAAASEHFQITSSQIIKLLRLYPPALALVNDSRASIGKHKLQ